MAQKNLKSNDTVTLKQVIDILKDKKNIDTSFNTLTTVTRIKYNHKGVYTSFGVITHPTNNCQLSCIYGTDQIIKLPEFKLIIQALYELEHVSNQVLFDVHKVHVDTILEAFKDYNCKVNQGYTSTNNSEMAIIVIALCEDMENDDDDDYDDDDY